MLRDRIFSAAILLLIFLISYLSQNQIYFLFLCFFASGILFYELAKLLKLKGLSLGIYWILSSSPIIFFYVILSLDIFFLSDPSPYVKNFLINFSIFMSMISLIFWLSLAPIDIMYKKISSNIKLKILRDFNVKVKRID